MRRRFLLQSGLVASMTAIASTTGAGCSADDEDLEAAAAALRSAVDTGTVAAAVLHVVRGGSTFSVALGEARSPDAMFLLGSISKPIAMTALMRLHDRRQCSLDDPVRRFLPQCTGGGRDVITLRQLLTHVSGLPDQLPENDRLRAAHAPLAEFVDLAQRTPLGFPPGSRYRYSSMGILLAAAIAERISGTEIRRLVDETVLAPLGMRHSAQGLGRFGLDDMVRCQTEHAAAEAGGGAASAQDWNWNSPYWRSLGAPWGGTHASAPDVARFLAEFLHDQPAVLTPRTARLMVHNHNPPGIEPRGLAFAVGRQAANASGSERSFGHTGSTGTLCWADPATRTICVVLTSLPARAVTPHPRDVASDYVASPPPNCPGSSGVGTPG
jgi:CubicO group peptidase (beta-lactamase class C family)